jgi:hypothetical protein
MAQSFGERMREQRERQQISLIAIAEQTKIKLSLLDALERDDVSQWPTGIFRRAFIRAYAHTVGLDPDAALRAFLEIYPDPAEATVPVPAVEPGAVSANGAPMRVRFVIRSAMDSVSRKIGLARRRQLHAPASPDVAARATASPGVATRVTARPAPPPPLPESPANPKDSATGNLSPRFDPARDAYDAVRLLHRAAGLLDAIGLVVWTWDPKASELVPSLVHGYSDERLAQFPTVTRDADNATAAAFRSSQTCIVRSGEAASGAVVVPLMTPSGCVGVLAVELQQGAEQEEPVRLLATSLAAQFAGLIGPPQLPHAVGA